MLDDPLANGIAFHVADGVAVVFSAEDAGVEASLPQVAATIVESVDVLAVVEMGASNDLGQRFLMLGHTDDMDMVVHEAVGVYTQSVLLGVVTQKCEIHTPVIVNREDILAVVAALSDVVRLTRHDNACESWHGPILSRNANNVK